jgi:hypothetical protein
LLAHGDKRNRLGGWAHYAFERGRVSARGGDSLEGLLEESCREDGGDILQVDRLAFSAICRGRTSDLRGSTYRVTQRAVRTAQRLTTGFFLSFCWFVGLGEGRTSVEEEFCWGFSQLLAQDRFVFVRDLYIFCCIIKIHKLKNWFSHIGFFQGLFYPKILVSLM